MLAGVARKVVGARLMTTSRRSPEARKFGSSTKPTVTCAGGESGATSTGSVALARPLASVVALVELRPSVNVTGCPASGWFVVVLVRIAATLSGNRYVAVKPSDWVNAIVVVAFGLDRVAV